MARGSRSEIFQNDEGVLPLFPSSNSVGCEHADAKKPKWTDRIDTLISWCPGQSCSPRHACLVLKLPRTSFHANLDSRVASAPRSIEM